jgi:GAF domain-containing protein
MALAAAVGELHDLSTLLLQVRNAVVEHCGFDRAGIFLYEPTRDVMRGTWGTTSDGEVEDIRHITFHYMSPYETGLGQMRLQGSGFELYEVEDSEFRPGYPEGTPTPWDRAVVELKVADELVGLLAVDNLLTLRPVDETAVQELLPFATNAALAIQKARLVADRDRMVVNQRRLMEVAAAIAGEEDLDEIFLKIRNAVMELGVVDRAGVWLLDGDVMRGTWGTEDDGTLRDERNKTRPIGQFAERIADFNENQTPYWFNEVRTVQLRGGESEQRVPHAMVALRAGREILGFLSVDTSITHRLIPMDSLAMLVPFAEQAAVAAWNRRLRDRSDRILRQQQSLVRLAVAIADEEDLDETCLMVRNAIKDLDVADRVAVWLRDGDQIRGTWGTTNANGLADDRHIRFPVDHLANEVAALEADGSAYWSNVWLEFRYEDGRTTTNVPHAGVALRTGSEFLGFIGLDTSLTFRPLKPELLALVVPFAEQLSAAIVKARIREERRQAEVYNRRLTEIAMMTSSNRDLDEIFLVVRNTVIELGVVDRVGVWVVEGDGVRGTWGTDNDGGLTDERNIRYRTTELSWHNPALFSGEQEYLVRNIPFTTGADGQRREDVPRVIVPMRRATIWSAS